jgi:hypothetical protein
MGFSFSSVVLSYFMIAGGTFFAALLAGRVGLQSEYLGYIVLALGGFFGGLVAARASRGSTIIEPALGAVLMIASFVLIGVAAGGDSRVLLMPAGMKAIGLTSAATAGGALGGAFLGEKLFEDDRPSWPSWVLFVSVAGFGAGIIGTTFGAFIGRGESGPMLGTLALASFIVGIAAGASATTRTLGASFLGGLLGFGGFFFLAIYMFAGVFGGRGAGAGNISAEAYAGMAILAAGAGLATMLGSAIGWTAIGKRTAG